jgi:hypothetical protein
MGEIEETTTVHFSSSFPHFSNSVSEPEPQVLVETESQRGAAPGSDPYVQHVKLKINQTFSHFHSYKVFYLFF